MGRGGKRENAGRKPKYPQHGQTKAIRVPEEIADGVEDAITAGTLFADKEELEKLHTQLNMLLLNWNQKSDEEKRQRLREISKRLGELLED